METKNKNHKIVKVTKCEKELHFIHKIMEVTGKRLETSRNIADSLFRDGQSTGTLLLNESNITPKQWEKIVKACPDVEWEYV